MKKSNSRKRNEVAYGWRTKPVNCILTQGTPPIGLEESPGNVRWRGCNLNLSKIIIEQKKILN